ncbi:MAG: FAD-dependent oxidoreductase [Clostridia bacterium]|nr:FAD-dependent oxidoreductase [Clostridia bacterium]
MKKLSLAALVLGISLVSATAFAQVADGTFTGTGAGRNGDIKVDVTFAQGSIADVVVSEQNETPGIADPALANIPEAIKANQSTAVEAVTGATLTSDGIVAAVKDAIAQAGGTEADFSAAVETAKSTEVVDLDCDVVVVGAGGSGMSAALAASQAGANVIIVEKSAAVGGSSIMSMGLGAVGSSMQKEVEMGNFTISQWMSDWLYQQNYMVSAPMIYKYMSESGKTVDWMLENGVALNYTGHEQGALEGNPIATYHVWAGDGLAAALNRWVDRVTENGGAIYYQTSGKSLIMENGAAKGVVAEQADGTTLNIHAKAVVLTTGGYGASNEMIEALLGFKTNGINSGTQTGDGINMAVAAGAATEGIENIEFHGVAIPNELKTNTIPFGAKDMVGLLLHDPTGIWVNKDGQRFANENIAYDTAYHGNIASRQGSEYYVIMTQKILDTYENEGQAALGRVTANTGFGPLPVDAKWEGFSQQISDYQVSGGLYKADTLEELAEKTGMNAKNLVATIAQYNAACANGEDDYLNKPAEFLTAMEEGPYYAVVARASQLGTLGGLKINTDMEVISTENAVIPGLYAAGVDSCGSMFNRVYVSYEGVTMGWTMTSGRLAGENAAAFVK